MSYERYRQRHTGKFFELMYVCTNATEEFKDETDVSKRYAIYRSVELPWNVFTRELEEFEGLFEPFPALRLVSTSNDTD